MLFGPLKLLYVAQKNTRPFVGQLTLVRLEWAEFQIVDLLYIDVQLSNFYAGRSAPAISRLHLSIGIASL